MAKNSKDVTSTTRWLVPALFTTTIFLSASLLFFVQPLFTKIVLPHLGGAPAVWTTAMLFFQTVLIGGYLYAHFMTRHLAVKVQIGVHLGLWAIALLFLPLAIPEDWRYDAAGSAAWQTLTIYGVGVGLPFLVLSANAPLIQAWYARSGGPSADDPYFLYGASNLGSFVALFGFPLLAEPLLGATQIGWGWMIGFWALGAFLLFSGIFARAPVAAKAKADANGASPEMGRVLRWVFLAFIPSSLMLAVTTKISTDIGSVPLVWVVPLALFLLTFVIVFRTRPLLPPKILEAGFFLGLGGLTIGFSNLIGQHITIPIAILLVLSFFAVSLYVHSQLYDLRPKANHLTTFYVAMSVGGALGGLLNSIVAPLIFNEIYEGAITVIAAAAIVLFGAERAKMRSLQISIVGIAVMLFLVANKETVIETTSQFVFAAVVFGILLIFILLLRSAAFAQFAYVAAVVVIGQVMGTSFNSIFADRSFFGTQKVLETDDGLRRYANGTTWHGAQRIVDLAAERPIPQSYYTPNGPMGQILQSSIADRSERIAIVGLGVGALSCFAKPGQKWHFYEIDPLVDRIARNPSLFTFMTQCGGDIPTHLGDARMVLADQHDLRFDILLIDAYSSDSVPVHLTTMEAFKIYLDRLDDGGVLAFHISNRYYAIERPIGRIAEALGLSARIQNYLGDVENDPGDGASKVVMLARDLNDLAEFSTDSRWQPLDSDGGRVWTDDFTNLLEILHR